MRGLAAGLATPLLAGCSGPLSTLDPAGGAASSVATLWWVMLAGATALLMLVLVLLAWSFMRSAGSVRPEVWLIGGGLVLPGVVLPPLLIYGLWGGEQLLARPGAAALTVEVHAERWRWTFRYPDAEGGPRTSTDVLHIPAGRPIDISVTSGDVIHSFWVPRLAGKIDAIPGHTNVLRLSADRPGIYHGTCAEFCGTGHTAMTMRVEVHAAEDYAARVSEMEPVP